MTASLGRQELGPHTEPQIHCLSEDMSDFPKPGSTGRAKRIRTGTLPLGSGDVTDEGWGCENLGWVCPHLMSGLLSGAPPPPSLVLLAGSSC